MDFTEWSEGVRIGTLLLKQPASQEAEKKIATCATSVAYDGLELATEKYPCGEAL
ncbi:MAG: hypothetical protein V4480_03915 [Patescibacteria group bacterium]